jgi:hypothetical protein
MYSTWAPMPGWSQNEVPASHKWPGRYITANRLREPMPCPPTEGGSDRRARSPLTADDLPAGGSWPPRAAIIPRLPASK